VYLLNQDCLNPASTGSYGILSGAHINVFVTGVGYVYEEIQIIPDIRITGNPETFKRKDYYLDFNAGTALKDKSLSETGKDLFDFILSVANGDVSLREDERKSRAFIMSYPKDEYYKAGEVNIENYPEKHAQKVEGIK
jgi:altronate dehydratase